MSNFDEPVLSQEQILGFHRDGYLCLEKLTDAADLELVQSLIDALFERFDELPKSLALDLGDVRNHDGRQITPQVNQATQFEPRLLETRTFRNAWSVARQLLGEGAVFSFDHAIYKPPHNGRETPWHQDMSYGAQTEMAAGTIPNRRAFGTNIWIPLQAATVESGCMWFVPHSHLGNLLLHHRVGHNPDNHTLVTDDVDPQRGVPCPLPKGGATVHQPKTLHYTGPNDTDMPRRAWIITFRVPLSN